MTLVGEIVEFAYGRALKESDRSGGPIPVVGSGGVVGGHEVGFTASPTIVVGRKGSIGSVTWIDGPAWPIDTAYYVKPRQSVDLRWLYWLLRSLRMETMNKSAAVPGLNREDVYRLDVKVPPVGEQRRLAAILDTAETLRTKRRQVLDQLDGLAQAVFQELFGGDVATATVGDIATIQGGLQVSTRRNELPVEVPYLRVANARRGRLDLAEVKRLRATQVEIERTQLRDGDLLFVEGHANPGEVGRVAMWRGEIDLCVHQNHLIRGRLDEARVIPDFAEIWLNSARGRAHFRRAGRTTSGLNTISAATVRTAPMLLPSLSRQLEFASKLRDVVGARGLVHEVAARDEELFSSLQARAFAGEL